jgi:hypothetical protein
MYQFQFLINFFLDDPDLPQKLQILFCILISRKRKLSLGFCWLDAQFEELQEQQRLMGDFEQYGCQFSGTFGTNNSNLMEFSKSDSQMRLD